MNRCSGVSVIELLVAVTIGATLIGMALPGLAGVVDRQRAASAHNLLLATLHHARAAAIVERRGTVVCPTVDGQSCLPGGVWEDGWMAFVDRNGNGTVEPDDAVLRHEASGVANLKVHSGASRPQVRFRPDGRSAGSNLSIRLCDGSGRPLQAIVVNNGGRARRTEGEETRALAWCL